MRELVELIALAIKATAVGLRSSVSPRNRRITLAVLVGGMTIAGANWVAMSQPMGESLLGLGPQGAAGAVFAPVYGGIVTGLIAGFSRRPLYADARAGTFAAFVGMAMLLAWTGVARANGTLPDGGAGFERFGPISGTMFVLVVGSANVFVTFPTAFVVMFASRSFVPNNRHRYGWLSADEDNPGLVYVTPGPRRYQPDLSRSSTAYSRFNQSPPRFSKIPSRFLDVEPE